MVICGMLFARQQVPDLPVFTVRNGGINRDFTALTGRDRLAVPVQNALARLRCDALAGRDDAGKIQRVCAADRYQLFGILPVTCFAHQADRLGQREVFAGKTLHETASPDFTPCLEPAEGIQQVAPWRQAVFSFEQPSEHDTVTGQQCTCDMFDPLRLILRR